MQIQLLYQTQHFSEAIASLSHPEAKSTTTDLRKALKTTQKLHHTVPERVLNTFVLLTTLSSYLIRI